MAEMDELMELEKKMAFIDGKLSAQLQVIIIMHAMLQRLVGHREEIYNVTIGTLEDFIDNLEPDDTDRERVPEDLVQAVLNGARDVLSNLRSTLKPSQS